MSIATRLHGDDHSEIKYRPPATTLLIQCHWASTTRPTATDDLVYSLLTMIDLNHVFIFHAIIPIKY